MRRYATSIAALPARSSADQGGDGQTDRRPTLVQRVSFRKAQSARDPLPATPPYAHGNLQEAIALPEHERHRLGLCAFRQTLGHGALAVSQSVAAGSHHRGRVFSRHIGRQHIETHYGKHQSMSS